MSYRAAAGQDGITRDLFRIFDLIMEDPGLSSQTTVVILHSQMPSSEHKRILMDNDLCVFYDN